MGMRSCTVTSLRPTIYCLRPAMKYKPAEVIVIDLCRKTASVMHAQTLVFTKLQLLLYSVAMWSSVLHASNIAAAFSKAAKVSLFRTHLIHQVTLLLGFGPFADQNTRCKWDACSLMQKGRVKIFNLHKFTSFQHIHWIVCVAQLMFTASTEVIYVQLNSTQGKYWCLNVAVQKLA